MKHAVKRFTEFKYTANHRTGARVLVVGPICLAYLPDFSPVGIPTLTLFVNMWLGRRWIWNGFINVDRAYRAILKLRG